MGTPASPISPDGTPHFCWTPGYNFNPAPTKRLIIIEFSGIEKRWNWTPADGKLLNGLWTLDQAAAGDENDWFHFPSGGYMYAYFTIGGTEIYCESAFNTPQFYANPFVPCEWNFTNQIIDDDMYAFHGGTAKLWIQGFNL